MNEFALAVIGAGPAGYTAALEAEKYGMKTCVVEAGELGGTCLNRGCIPTKTLLHTAMLAKQVREGAEIGLKAENVGVDMERLQSYKRQVVEKLSGGIARLLEQRRVAVVRGTATVVSPHEVRVDGTAPATLTADRILVAAGSEPAELPVPGIGLPGVLTSDAALEQKTIFGSAVIVGGGVIGMEFASLYAALGTRVTVIEAMDRILANMDREIGQNLAMILKKQGVALHTGASLKEIRRTTEGGLACVYEENGAEAEARAETVLVAVGRKPATERLFAPDCTPRTERGRLLVDEDGRTSIPYIYAAGDASAGPQLAHAAFAEAINAVAAMRGARPPVRTDVIPACVYTSPEIAVVGLSPDEAKRRGIAVEKRKYLMGANGKTVLTRQERGFITLVAEEGTGVVLGAQMMCARATDMIGEFASTIVNRLTVRQLAAAVRPHPTFNEAVWELTRE